MEDLGAPGGEREQTWYYPGPSDCETCHTPASGTVLGVRTKQLNRDRLYPNAVTDNQLRAWNHIELFASHIGSADQYGRYSDPYDPSEALEARARSYLASNCAHCHQPGVPRSGSFDLRFETATSEMNVVDVPAEFDDLGFPEPFRVKTQDKESSLLWERMRRLDVYRMPPLASSVVDAPAVELVGTWIDQLGSGPAPPPAPTNLSVN